MDKLSKRYVLLISFLMATAILVNLLNYDIDYQQESALETIKKIPEKIGKWKGHDYPLQELVYEILETRSIIHRNYTAADSSVFLSLVYYPETKVDFHSPEGCLAGDSVKISKSYTTVSLKKNKAVFKVNELIRENSNSRELIYYFFKAGDNLGESYIKLRFRLAMEKLLGKPKSGSLIRVSTPLKTEKQSGEILVEFIDELYPYIMSTL